MTWTHPPIPWIFQDGISKELLSHLYTSSTIEDAARLLGVGVTALKKRCREVGIKRWPHRQVRIALKLWSFELATTQILTTFRAFTASKSQQHDQRVTVDAFTKWWWWVYKGGNPTNRASCDFCCTRSELWDSQERIPSSSSAVQGKFKPFVSSDIF